MINFYPVSLLGPHQKNYASRRGGGKDCAGCAGHHLAHIGAVRRESTDKSIVNHIVAKRENSFTISSEAVHHK